MEISPIYTFGRFIAFVLILFGTSWQAARAQPIVPWDAWLYDSASAQVWRVNALGTVLAADVLPTSPGDVLLERATASRSGDLIAYVAQTGTGARLNVYNTISRTLIMTYAVPSAPGGIAYNSFDFFVSPAVFSPDDRTLAFGYQVDDEWTLLQLDVTTGAVLGVLTRGHPIFAPLAFGGFTPQVTANTGTDVYFMLILTGAGGAATYPAYRWQPLGGSIVEDSVANVAGQDLFLRTNEVLKGMYDEAFPNRNAEIMGPFNHTNTVQVGVLGTGTTSTVLADGNLVFSQPRFVQNGERVLSNLYTIDLSSNFWNLYDRSGVYQGSPTLPDNANWRMAGTGDGFIYVVPLSEVITSFPGLGISMDQHVLMNYDTRFGLSGIGQPVWVGPDPRPFNIIWVNDNAAASRGLPTSTPWTVLASSGGPVPTPIPAVSVGVLAIGGQAVITTTEGDRANMRSGPGADFSIVDRLSNGTLVTLVEGPRFGGSFTWWRVQTASGAVGWVVESADGVQVLVPTGGGAPAPATLAPGGRAIVTSEGGRLNVRTNPSTSAAVLTVLNVGSVVSIVDGPVNADGLIWWRVQTDAGNGWVAEGLGPVRWLAPFGG